MGRGMVHEFRLIKASDIPLSGKDLPTNGEYPLHDDFLSSVMVGTVKWIPWKNPWTGKEVPYMDICGPNFIDADGAEQAKKIFRAWREIVATGPELQVYFCGSSWQTGETDEGEGKLVPHIARFSRFQLLHSLDGIISYLDQVGPDFVLLHLGF